MSQNSILVDDNHSPGGTKQDGKKGIRYADGKDSKRKIQDHYVEIFRKEVDFHHKVAYRFEKAYRLAKKTSERK